MVRCAPLLGAKVKLAMITGQPIAWEITDTEDTNSSEEFFKARVPEATITALMTNDSQ